MVGFGQETLDADVELAFFELLQSFLNGYFRWIVDWIDQTDEDQNGETKGLLKAAYHRKERDGTYVCLWDAVAFADKMQAGSIF